MLAGFTICLCGVTNFTIFIQILLNVIVLPNLLNLLERRSRKKKKFCFKRNDDGIF